MKRRVASGRRLALALAVVGAAAGWGCRSATVPPSGEDGGLFSWADTLDEAGRSAARAHAAYATGLHHEAMGEGAEAEAWYRKALEASPEEGRYAVRVASALLQQGRVREALEFAEGRAAAKPDEAGTRRWLAGAYAEAKEWGKAATHARAAVEASPGDPAGWLLLSLVEEKGPGGVPAAMAVLEEGIGRADPPTELRRRLVHLSSHELEGLPDEAPESLAVHARIIEQLRAVDRESPGDENTLQLLSAMLLARGEAEEGLRTLARYGRLRADDDGDPAWQLAAALIPAERVEETAAALRKLRETGEAPADSWLLEAALWEKAGNPEAEGKALERAVEESPHDIGLWVRYATAFNDDPERMAGILKEGLKANPGEPKLLELRGVAQCLLHRYSAAKRDLLRAAEGFEAGKGAGGGPNEKFPLALALVLTRTGQHAEAAKWLARAVEDHGKPAIESFAGDSLFVPPRGHRGLVKTLQAFAEERAAAGDGEGAAAGHVYLALSHLDHGEYRAAAREFEKNESYYPDPVSIPAKLSFMHAVALDLGGKKAEAEERMETLTDIHPRYAEAQNYLAFTWAEQSRRLDEALLRVKLALVVEPYNAAYLDTLAWVLHRLGEQEEAWENILLAERLRPGDPEIEAHKEAIREALEGGGGEEPGP